MEQQNEDVKTLISQAKASVQFGGKRLSTGFAHVPDEKLEWSPAPTSRSALRIVSHVGFVGKRLAALYRGDNAGAPPPPDFAEMMRQQESSVTSREQALALLEDSTASVLAALDTLNAERIASDAHTIRDVLPMRQMMMIAGLHIFGHAAQIDYLQTMWGDTETHF